MKPLTYISLFSSAGVGCYGFKMEGFNCVATNELLPRRLDVQKCNNKCKYDSGYILGDILLDETRNKILSQIDLWKQKENMAELTVLIATPPCQGMSVANHKKKDENKRNSLVVASLSLIQQIQPRYFVLENVKAFLNTICTDVDGSDKRIRQAINDNLAKFYNIEYKVLNFKNYGANSSRTIQNVHDIFRKVQVDSSSASNEYDKFFGQPIKLFAYAGILEEEKLGRENKYRLINRNLLEYISLRERNALQFLIKYIGKVVEDSGLSLVFDEFFNQQNSQAYDNLKNTFFTFTVANTAIGSKGSNGKLECGRIFTKVVNVLAFNLNKRGTEKGRISQHAITYDMLMYNRDNFRDIYAEKPKSVSRKDYIAQQHIVINEAYYRYLSTKAKRRLKQYNDNYRNGLSEMLGWLYPK